MPEVVLRLVRNPRTGAHEVVIDYRSDEDSLPMEHEEQHRAVVSAVLEGESAGEGVDIERGNPAAVPQPQASPQLARELERKAEKE